MKPKTIILVGMICLICLAMLAPAVSAADLIPFNRSAVKPGDAFYSGSTIVTTPDGAKFSKPVTISFTLSPAQWGQALEVTNGNTNAIVVAAFDEPNQTWKYENPATVTTAADGSHVVSGTTTHTGLFSVFYIVVPLNATAGPSTQTFGSMVTGTTAAPVTSAAAVASPAVTTGKPQSAPTQSPGLPGIVVVGVIGAVGFLVMRRNQ